MKSIRKLALGLAAVVSVMLPAVGASTAHAATNPYTPQSVCGSGYTDVVSWFSISGGNTYLLYNPSNGYNCATTIKTSSIGTATKTGVYLSTSSTSQGHVDSGNYSYFAGPVYYYAPATCVWYGGQTATSGGWWGAGPVGCN